MASMVAMVAGWALQALALWVGATFAFDCVHWAMHRFERMPLGRWHQTHHAFLSPALQFDEALRGANLRRHRVPQLAIELLATALGLSVFQPVAVFAVFGLLTLRFVRGSLEQGHDRLHRAVAVVPGALGGAVVSLGYHCLHHVSRRAYFGTSTTLFDRVFGTGCDVRGKRVVITGASGAFGQPFKALLEREGATVTALKFRVDFDQGQYRLADAALQSADVLVLAHGAKKEHAMEANCGSFVGLIERFKGLTAQRRLPPEVWAVGSEIEAHPAWGNPDLQVYLESKRAFARHARRYFHDPFFIYRHIVPSAFTSPMGPGLISGRLAAAWAWFFIKRGFRYVPVSYTGIALLNYFKFAFAWHQASDPSPDLRRTPHRPGA